jgi:glycosyltransferase involved in cell wall biosynthesis
MSNATDQKNIIYCSPYYKKSVHSGANRRFEEICQRFLNEFGNRFTLIISKGERPDWYTGNAYEVPYKFNHISKFITLYHIAKILNTLPPSIIINEFIPIPFRALKRHRHLQVAYDFRYFTSNKGSLYRLAFGNFLKRQWQKSEFMVTCSNFSINELLKYLNYRRDKVIKSYFGVDMNLLDRNNNPTKTIDILYVGHFETRKNHANLIEALRLLPRDLVVKFVGVDNGLQQSLEQCCRDYNLEHVSFETISDDNKLWPLYQQSKLFVFPSVYEGFGMPLIEALALNTPVACSDIEIFREIGQDLVTYFDPNNPADIADKIKQALANPQPLDRQKIRRHLEQFSWNTIYRVFVDDIKDICK